MKRSLLTVAPLTLLALAACGTKTTAGNQPRESQTERSAMATLNLTSDDIRNGQPIAARFTCDGAGDSPTLHWSDPPAGTKSFALVVDDPDAPSGTFRHWGVFDIPASARSTGGETRAGTEVANDFGKPGYGGPCPPRGGGPHHYHFKVFALDADRLGIAPGAKVKDVETAAAKHALASGELVATYERQ